ncbi:LPXTG cell wall anchor domain-containing protein [Streptomyces sp. NPDC087297]|uniref:LPXTG cell wall anchor domain-containing protein n=1 Tax=Streptomyces sp. NPDC087297 TaxID=3365778 RepID=UPI003810D5E8
MSVRTAAAIAVVAGVVTTLLPLSATAVSAAPVADDQAVLRTEMGAPVPSGSLTRGGATETFDLTVKNPTGKPVQYKPWMLVDQTGPSRLQKDDVVFKVDAVDAPATKSSVGQQDGGWQGLFYPATAGGKESGAGFDIPANGKMTWKVTIGLGAHYPTNDGDFTFTATSWNNSVAPGGADSHLFKVAPQIKAGELKTWFKQVSSGKDGQEQRAYLDLNYQATGEGTFDTALATTLSLSHPGEQKADFRLQALIDGRWQDLEGAYDRYELPRIPKGFGASDGVRTLPLRVSLGKNTGLTKKTVITMEAEVSHAEGNTYPFKNSSVQFPLAPIVETVPPSGTPSGSPSPAPAPSTTPSTTPVVQQAVATTAGNANLTTTAASNGSLAHTGADSGTGLYAGLAAALVALGAAAAWLGRRRRTAA